MIFATWAEPTHSVARVEQVPSLRFDVYDFAGYRRPPILTIAPRTPARLEGSPQKMRWSTAVAVVFIAIGPFLIWFDWTYYEGVMVVPTIVGINLILIAARILIMNTATVPPNALDASA